MSDHELRDLLHRVVPDAPAPDPHGPVALARRWRARRRTGVVVGVAALVAGVLTTVSLVGSDPRRDATPAPVAPSPSLTTEPYDANVCPPVADRTSVRTIDLDDVLAVAECSVPSPGDPQSVPVTPEAYLGDASLFARLVEAAGSPNLRRCKVVDREPRRTLVFHREDGSAATLDLDRCSGVRSDRRTVLDRALEARFSVALDRQRNTYDYAETVDPPTCDQDGALGPARPQRETLVSGVVCSGHGRGLRRLDQQQVQDLQRAWSEARGLGDEGFCTGGARLYGYVLASTDRGDTVRFDESRCADYLVTQAGGVQIDIADLVAG